MKLRNLHEGFTFLVFSVLRIIFYTETGLLIAIRDSFRYGHTIVPQLGEDKSLGTWVAMQRVFHRKGELSNARYEVRILRRNRPKRGASEKRRIRRSELYSERILASRHYRKFCDNSSNTSTVSHEMKQQFGQHCSHAHLLFSRCHKPTALVLIILPGLGDTFESFVRDV